jgi:hypothetical protein
VAVVGKLKEVGMQRILVGLALLLVVAGCDSGSQGGRALTGATRASTTTLAGATSTTAGVPQACTAAGTTALVKGFFAALSQGRVEDLARFFAPPMRFQWYANGVEPGVRLDESARDRSTLLGYLQQRQAMREHMVVEAVDFNGYRDADRTAHFGMLLRRAADDIPGGPQLLLGKGAVDCDTGRLMVISIGAR